MINRNSGTCVDLECVLKTGPGALAQAEFIRSRPDAFIPVLGRTENGYVMPRWEELTNQDVDVAFHMLKTLWSRSSIRSGPIISVDAYHDYVMRVHAPTDLKEIANIAFEVMDQSRLHPVFCVHGDATLENVVVRPSSHDARWIDPNTRPVPFVAELDAGKVLQSLYGYDGDWTNATRQTFTLWARHLDPDGLRYFFLTHLIRLWPYQPDHHDWVTKVMRGHHEVRF